MSADLAPGMFAVLFVLALAALVCVDLWISAAMQQERRQEEEMFDER